MVGCGCYNGGYGKWSGGRGGGGGGGWLVAIVLYSCFIIILMGSFYYLNEGKKYRIFDVGCIVK